MMSSSSGSGGCERIVVLVDMDCFYVQVEERDHPAIRGRPAAVVQYNTHRGGGIIAVNYEARACGVKRGMRGTDAAEACPEIQLVRVPMLRNKANLSKYRNAGKEVLDVLCQFSDVVERASIDEAYLDVTQVVDDIIKRGYYSQKTQCDNLKNDTQNFTSHINRAHSDDKNDKENKDSEIGGQKSVSSVIPNLEDLPTTWVELPFSQSEREIFDLNDEDQRRKYEMETTVVSHWTPKTTEDDVQAELEVEEGEDSVDEHGDLNTTENLNIDKAEAGTALDSGVQSSEKAKTNEEKEAERVGGLSRWLESIRKSSPLSQCDAGAEANPALGCDGPPHDGKERSSSSAASRVGNSDQYDAVRLAVAAHLCEDIRASVRTQTGFKCSAGIAHNKVLAKLVCGLHKPNQQTVLPTEGVEELWRHTPVRKVRNLGGKLGHSLEAELGCTTMADVSALPLSTLSSRYDDKTARWLYELGRGRDTEAVVARQLPKSVGCSKNFLGPETLHTRTKVQEWTRALAEELAERLEEDQNLNKRVARTLTVSYRLGDRPGQNSHYGPNTGSKSCPLPSYAPERIAAVALTLLNACNTAKQGDKWTPALLNIGMSAGKFDDCLSAGMPSISDMFKRAELRPPRSDASTSTASQSADQQHQSEGETPGRVSHDHSISSVTEPEVDTGQRVKRQEGIQKFFSTDQPSPKSDLQMPSENTRRTSISATSTESDSILHQNDAENHVAKQGNSFFKNFLMRKKASGSEQEGQVSSTSRLTEADEDSREALNILVEALDTSDDDDLPLSDDLKTKKIIESTPVQKDANDSVYEVSTDEDEKAFSVDVVGNRGSIETCTENSVHCKSQSEEREPETATKSRSVDPTVKLDSSSNDSNAIETVSVMELFPNLDEVDESLLPHLPPDLRKAVKLALVRHRAEKAGREALDKTGITRFMKKIDKKDRQMQDTGNTSTESIQKPHSAKENSFYSSKASSSASIFKYVRANNPRANEFETSPQAGPSFKRTINLPSTPKSMKADRGTSLNWGRPPVNDQYKNEEESTESQLSSAPQEDCFTKCEVCGASVSYSEVAEHADYHVALQLQEQFQSGAGTASSSSNSNHGASLSSTKTKKRKKLKQSASESKKTKTIDCFFNK